MYHIAICDDDEVFIQYIKRLFGESSCAAEEMVFYEYLSGEELLEDMKKQERYDLLILDICLEGIDGNAAAKKFRTLFPDTVLVFCSGVALPTVESFETTPFRYWLKEYTEERMKKELEAVIRKLQSQRKIPTIIGKQGTKLIKLDIENVLYIEISKRGSVIHYDTVQGEQRYTSDIKVAEYYEMLREFGFAYAHNSYIVNLEQVAVAGVKELELMNGKLLSISRSRVKEFRKLFACKLARKYDF